MNVEDVAQAASKQCLKLEDKKEPVHVFVRLRPLNSREHCGRSLTAVEIKSNKEITVHTKPTENISKTFKFDKIFGPQSTQEEVFNTVVSPLMRETLAGYNCTVFAYGPTGTGKTYTMEGILDDDKKQAGIIPIFLSRLFNELHTLEKMDCMVKVSCLEIYNEELFDLLSPAAEATKVRLYENTSKKGTVILQGLSEIMVDSETQVYQIFKRVSERRQTGSTQLNNNSSRSHVIFSIILNFKEDSENGESLIRMGKLNLVDLAGSENIRKSGASNQKAKEAGNINQSLLTLGRVITALADRAVHVPYRESKLTRILQESLGGPTKTSIIATVSPSQLCIEETLSTLEYAFRAKNITNKPQMNKKLSEDELIKAWATEIAKLRKELSIAHEQNGVYMAQESYDQMVEKIQNNKKELNNLSINIKDMDNKIKDKEASTINLQKRYDELGISLNQLENKRQNIKLKINEAHKNLKDTEKDLRKHKNLTKQFVSNEGEILNMIGKISNTIGEAVGDFGSLKETIHRKDTIEQKNEELCHEFEDNIARQLDHLREQITTSTAELSSSCSSVKNEIDVVKNQMLDNLENLTSETSKQSSDKTQICSKLMEIIKNYYKSFDEFIENQSKSMSCVTENNSDTLKEISKNFESTMKNLVINEIIPNMQVMKNYFSLILKSVEAFKDNFNNVQVQQLNKYDILIENLLKLQQNMEKVAQQQKENVQHRKDFALALESANFHLQASMEKDQSIESLLKTNLKIKDVIKNQIIEHCDQEIRARQSCSEKNQQILEFVVHNMTAKLKQMTDDIMENSTLACDLNINFDENLNMLMDFKESTSSELSQLISKTENIQLDCDNNLEKAQQVWSDLSERTKNTQKIHHQQLGDLEENLSHEMNERRNIIDNQFKDLTNTLDSMNNQVDGLILDDWNRDTPSGSTPSKKEFNYPRQLPESKLN